MNFGDALGLLGYFAARIFRGPFPIDIRHRPGGPTKVGGTRVARARAGAIREFFARDLNPPGVVRVWGSLGPGRSLRLNFAGPIDAAGRQRARNVLTELLR